MHIFKVDGEDDGISAGMDEGGVITIGLKGVRSGFSD
jgi:hypothetical protein